jgi:hypothetical protein
MALLTSLILPVLSLAALLNGEGDGGALEGVKVPAKARVEVQGRVSNLSSVGVGLRFKKVVFVKAKVYVGQLFLSEPAVLKKNRKEALESLSGAKVAAMQLHFLRDVDAPTVEAAFRDSFKENKISLDQEPIQKFLAAVKAGGGAKEGKTLTVVGEKLGARELVTYEGTDGNPVTVEGPAGFRKEIFALWLGEPTDGGVENLQEGLLK